MIYHGDVADVDDEDLVISLKILLILYYLIKWWSNNYFDLINVLNYDFVPTFVFKLFILWSCFKKENLQ